MPRLAVMVNPASYVGFLQKRLRERRLREQPNLRGIAFSPPGHFYSPLLNIQSMDGGQALPFDGPEDWEHVGLRPVEERAFYEELLQRFPILPFPPQATPGRRYYHENTWFPISDAFVLSGLVRREKPARIVEVGSGFSSAVMLDTLDDTRQSAALTFIEPYPQRLYTLLSERDKSAARILVSPVQEVPLSVFDELGPSDILFIDSSHVAKIGSDVTFLLLRVLPRLRPGVLVHFHDVFYPHSYPADWIREGRAWNESLFLRAFLLGNTRFHVLACNSFAAAAFPEVFRASFPQFLERPGSSIWLRKIA